MSVLSILLLILIVYFCAKAIGSIWRDAFGTIDGGQRQQHTTRTQQHTAKKPTQDNQPIGKNEGEYVDYEEL